jgi:nicotinate-nucleotide adenylyltransferase
MSLNGLNEMMIGVFGGTFDPPHLGHMILAEEAYDQLGLDRLLFVLTADPPHKKNQSVSPWDVRLKLLGAAIEGNTRFELSRIDIDRPPPHYAVDTVKIITYQFPGAGIVYLMGSDSLVELPTWHKPQGFVDACSALGVICRPDFPVNFDILDAQIPGISAKVKFVDAPLLEIASSEIRERILQNRPYRYYLLPAVYNLVQELNLYQGD